jgi:Ca2+:H+ antiporter
MVASIFLLRSKQIQVLQTSLVGSTIILTLFNMGGAFIWGGWKRGRQYFNRQLARTMSSLLSVSVFGVIIPTAFDKFSDSSDSSVAAISRGTSVILIAVYLFYVLHEYTRKRWHDMEEEPDAPGVLPGCVLPKTQASKDASDIGRPSASTTGADKKTDIERHKEKNSTDENDEVKLSIRTSIVVLVLGTAILAFNTQFMTDSISGIAEGAGAISLAFIGLVLIPMLSNDVTAFQNAAQDKMDIAIQCALGRSLQMTLLVIPGSVLIAWMMDIEMTLAFDGFYMAILFISTLVVYTGISNGKSNW